MHLKVFTKCQMLCNAYDDMSGFSILNTRGVTLTCGHFRSKGGQKPAEGTLDHFEKLLEGPCLNHAFPIKHLYKDCVLMKQFLFGGSNKGEHRKEPKPTIDDAAGKDGGSSMLDGCLMIFRGSAAYDSKRRQKLACRKVYTAKLATPTFLH